MDVYFLTTPQKGCQILWTFFWQIWRWHDLLLSISKNKRTEASILFTLHLIKQRLVWRLSNRTISSQDLSFFCQNDSFFNQKHRNTLYTIYSNTLNNTPAPSLTAIETSCKRLFDNIIQTIHASDTVSINTVLQDTSRLLSQLTNQT